MEHKKIKPCRTWLPEFGQDNECCGAGLIIDIDVYTEGYDPDDFQTPCFICNKKEFIDYVTEYFPQDEVFDGSDGFWAVFAAWRATERLLKEEKEKQYPLPQPDNSELVKEIDEELRMADKFNYASNSTTQVLVKCKQALTHTQQEKLDEATN